MAFSEWNQDQAQWSVDEDARSLFFCVAHYYGSKGKVIYTGYSLDVNALFSSSTHLELENAFTLSSKDQIGACAGLGVGLGCLILAGGIRANYSMEKLVGEPCSNIWLMSRSNNFQPQAAEDRFLAGKVRPLIWEFEGNLFALARNPRPPICTGSLGEWSICFEKYSSATGEWVSLPDPPSYSFQIPGRPGGGASDEDVKRGQFITRFYHAVIGSQLFITNPMHPDYSYTCNLSSPIEWKISSFGFEGVTLGVKTTQGFVVFSYDITRSFDDVPDYSLVIGVKLLLDGCDEPEPCKPLVLAPDLYRGVGDAQLVDLGDQKVCFLCSVVDGLKLTVNAITFGFQLDEGNRLRHNLYPIRSWEFQNKDNAFGIGVTQLVGAVVG